ncbi:NADH-quinone oxidoreductase subunit C [Myxococcota bacterium]|nr:NADH-quinone oxidoreductase subunit C [Myxococcota bacterium]
MAKIVLDRLQRKFGDAIIETSSEFGNDTAVVSVDKLLEIATFIKEDRELLFDMPIDCSAVDWYQKREIRYDVIWHFYSMTHKNRLRIKIWLGEDNLNVPSLTPLWRGFNWHERETWDLYGIRFEDHPNLKRILLYEEFEGHPLRKDYPMDKRQPLVEMLPVKGIPTQRDTSTSCSTC